MIEIPWGEGFIFDFPLIDAGAQGFVTDHTPAAGDAKLSTDDIVAANPTAETIAFTSGSEAPRAGDTLTGATSAETLVVIGYRLTSGTWGGGTAAGELFVHTASGVFQAENLNNTTTGTANVMTIGADLDGAGIFQYIENGYNAAAITPAEAQTKFGRLMVIDVAGAEWEDQAILFKTYGHPLAADSRGVAYAGYLDAPATDIDSSGTWIDLPLTYDYQSPANDDDINGAWIEVEDDSGVIDGDYITDFTASSGRCLLLNGIRYDLTGAGWIKYNVYLERNVPANVRAKLATLDLTATEQASVNAQCDTAISDGALATAAGVTAAHVATDADIAAVQALAAASAAWGAINSGIVFRGPVSAADPGVSFTIGGLAGQGAGAFIDANTPWYAYVFRDAGGIGGAPQGEVRQITGYTSATGLFTTAAFTVPVAVGDDIIIMSGRIAAIPEILADTGTTIPAQLAAAHVTTDALITAVSGKLPAFVGLKKGTAIEDFTIPMRDADGDLVSGLTVTGQIKKDGGAFAALTSTITEDGTTGMYDLTTSPALSASEMNADQVVLLFTATGAKPTIIQIFTES
jgi:hypothetical protein